MKPEDSKLAGVGASVEADSSERALRKLYLKLFLRGRSGRALQKDGAPGSVMQRLWVSLLVYALFGLFSLSFAKQTVLPLSVYLHGMTFVLLGLFVAGSAGEVLFNKDEAEILLHRPVTAEAMLKAKISVLLQVSLSLAGALNLAGFFVGMMVRDGSWLFLPVHAFSMLLEALFCTSAVVVSYQLCLRWFGRERLDNLMTGVQVLMAISIMLAGQVMPRFLGRLGGHIVLDAQHGWLALFPPVWFACLDDGLAGSGGLISLALSCLALLCTLAFLWLAFRVLARDYEEGLRSLQETVSIKPLRVGGRRWLSSLLELPPLCWWLRDGVARSSFLLVSAYLFRDRDVKLRVYPGLAPMLIMPVVMLLNVRTGAGANATLRFFVAFAGCYVGMLPFMALGMLQFSQHWQAAEIFRAAPLLGPGELCHGARKAVLLLLTLPIILLIILGLSFLRMEPQLFLLLLPGLIAIPVCSLLPPALQGFVPLSEPVDQAQGGSRMVVMLVSMLGSLGLAGVAVLAWSFDWYGWFLLLEAVVMSLAYYLLRTRVSRLSWEPVG